MSFGHYYHNYYRVSSVKFSHNICHGPNYFRRRSLCVGGKIHSFTPNSMRALLLRVMHVLYAWWRRWFTWHNSCRRYDIVIYKNYRFSQTPLIGTRDPGNFKNDDAAPRRVRLSLLFMCLLMFLFFFFLLDFHSLSGLTRWQRLGKARTCPGRNIFSFLGTHYRSAVDIIAGGYLFVFCQEKKKNRIDNRITHTHALTHTANGTWGQANRCKDQTSEW